jgi:hypothetical protein
MERLYQQMLKIFKEQGYPKSPSQTPWEYAQYLQTQEQMTQAEMIEEISQAYVRWRYGTEAVNLQRLQHQLQQLKKSQIKRFRTRLLKRR